VTTHSKKKQNMTRYKTCQVTSGIELLEKILKVDTGKAVSFMFCILSETATLCITLQHRLITEDTGKLVRTYVLNL